MAEQRSKPEKSFRSGAISVAVWKNTVKAQNSRTSLFRTVSFERRYKNADGQWQSTSQLRRDDIPRLVYLLNKAYEHIITSRHDQTADSNESTHSSVEG